MLLCEKCNGWLVTVLGIVVLCKSKAFWTFSAGCQQHEAKFVIGFIWRQIQLVETGGRERETKPRKPVLLLQGCMDKKCRLSLFDLLSSTSQRKAVRGGERGKERVWTSLATSSLIVDMTHTHLLSDHDVFGVITHTHSLSLCAFNIHAPPPLPQEQPNMNIYCTQHKSACKGCTHKLNCPPFQASPCVCAGQPLCGAIVSVDLEFLHPVHSLQSSKPLQWNLWSPRDKLEEPGSVCLVKGTQCPPEPLDL